MTISREAPQTPVEEVILGLYLALIAPTPKERRACVRIVGTIATGANLSEQEIDTAKARALAEFHILKALDKGVPPGAGKIIIATYLKRWFACYESVAAPRTLEGLSLDFAIYLCKVSNGDL